MGKKVMMRSQAANFQLHKISKNNSHHNHENKKDLNNLIKFLKPKVYITDSSNFKNLVQQLTGNGNSPIISSPPQENSQQVTIDSSSEGSQDMDLSEEYRRIESWLLEMESCSDYHYVGYDLPLVQEQVSLYDCDYDLSSLL